MSNPITARLTRGTNPPAPTLIGGGVLGVLLTAGLIAGLMALRRHVPGTLTLTTVTVLVTVPLLMVCIAGIGLMAMTITGRDQRGEALTMLRLTGLDAPEIMRGYTHAALIRTAGFWAAFVALLPSMMVAFAARSLWRTGAAAPCPPATPCAAPPPGALGAALTDWLLTGGLSTLVLVVAVWGALRSGVWAGLRGHLLSLGSSLILQVGSGLVPLVMLIDTRPPSVTVIALIMTVMLALLAGAEWGRALGYIRGNLPGQT